MSLVAATLVEFGRSIGMDDLDLRNGGALVLQVEGVGTLAFDRAGPRGESVVISLARPLRRASEVDWRTLLAATHPRARTAVPVHLGLLRDHLLLSIVLPQEEFTLTTLHEAIRTLDEQHGRLGVTI